MGICVNYIVNIGKRWVAWVAWVAVWRKYIMGQRIYLDDDALAALSLEAKDGEDHQAGKLTLMGWLDRCEIIWSSSIKSLTFIAM